MNRPEDKKIQSLKKFFEARDEVIMAFLFGSRVDGRERKTSDWDIGVYLKNENRDIECSLWREIEKLLEKEVDLVVLNRAPAVIAWRIIGQGDILTIKDQKLYLDFLIRISEEADAFYRTSREYYQIFERSTSLNVGDRDRLFRILSFLEEEVKEYPKFRNLTWKEYSGERAKKREIEHWIEHLVNAMVDIAKIILASEHRPIPETYVEMIATLGSIAPFKENNLCEKLAGWIRLRNILAHEYLDINWKNISEFVNETEQLWYEMIAQTKKFLEIS